MNETNRTCPNLVAKIQVYMLNKTPNSSDFSLLRKSGSYKNMLNFMAIVYIKGSGKIELECGTLIAEYHYQK